MKTKILCGKKKRNEINSFLFNNSRRVFENYLVTGGAPVTTIILAVFFVQLALFLVGYTSVAAVTIFDSAEALALALKATIFFR